MKDERIHNYMKLCRAPNDRFIYFHGRHLQKHYAWWYDDQYQANFNLLWWVDKPDVVAFVKNVLDADAQIEEHFAGKCWSWVNGKKGTHFVIALNNVCRGDRMELTQVVTHECLHAANQLLWHRGVELDPKDDEPLCYYHGMLLRRVLEILKQQKP